MKKIVFDGLLFIVLFLGFYNISSAQSPQSDPTKSLTCMIETDFYIVHLTAYQEPEKGVKLKKRKKFEPFCQELPNHGVSYLAIDFIDRDLRKMPVGMRVIEKLENPDGEGMIDGAIIAETAPKNYKRGVADIQVDFPKPGHYALIAMVGDDMFADKIEIPLRVGIGSVFSFSSLYPFVFFMLAAAIGYVIYRFFLSRHKRKENNGYHL